MINEAKLKNTYDVSLIQAKNGIKLRFKVYLKQDITEYDDLLKYLWKDLEALESFEDLGKIIKIIRENLKYYDESFLEVEITGLNIRKYVEYIDKELYVLEYFKKTEDEIDECYIYDILNRNNDNIRPQGFDEELISLKNVGIESEEKEMKLERVI
ncbi:MAG: hypothetical protein E7158_04685 [Firmicutes bacterium]|nr:hypothetical protein [Bacillota bacterium]